MIGYYANTGDLDASKLFVPYLRGIGAISKSQIHVSFDDLELILVAYYVEGKFSDLDWIGDSGYKVSNFSQKEKSIRVNVAVRRADFHDRSDMDRRLFLIESTKEAVRLVAERMAKKKLIFEHQALLDEVDKAGALFMSQPLE